MGGGGSRRDAPAPDAPHHHRPASGFRVPPCTPSTPPLRPHHNNPPHHNAPHHHIRPAAAPVAWSIMSPQPSVAAGWMSTSNISLMRDCSATASARRPRSHIQWLTRCAWMACGQQQGKDDTTAHTPMLISSVRAQAYDGDITGAANRHAHISLSAHPLRPAPPHPTRPDPSTHTPVPAPTW